jgi:prepilin-type processing-associated H-X9-DG protein
MADADQGTFNTLFADGHVRRLNWKENYDAWYDAGHWIQIADRNGQPKWAWSVFK